jgi:hypothetical protein
MGRPVSARAITVSVTFFADLRRFMPRGEDKQSSRKLTVASHVDLPLLKVSGRCADRAQIVREARNLFQLMQVPACLTGRTSR